MSAKSLSGRATKQRIYALLKSPDLASALNEISRLPGRQVINPLFSLLYNRDQDVRWSAVKAMGMVVAKMADEDMESARVIMRRLMWNLNDESGGIGWGSPEAMGEIMACHHGLAKEYAHILISYTREDGNYLEHEVLQRGLIWGIGRLAQVSPHILQDGVQHLFPYLESTDATVRGLAAWVMGLLTVDDAVPQIRRLKNDENQIQMYTDQGLVNCRVMDLAEEALDIIQGKTDTF
ncbi:MAG: HEAT repeat domain-containing protein [Desulfobacteraceae bacterium]